MARLRRGGGKIAVADATDVPVAVNGNGYWISADVDAWVTTGTSTGLGTLSAANATLIRSGMNYGPFQTIGGVDTHLHVASAGAAGNVWVTVI